MIINQTSLFEQLCPVPQSCPSLLRLHGLEPTRLLCSCGFSGKNTGTGYHFLFKGIFLTWESNPQLPYLLQWQVDSLPLSSLGGPNRILFCTNGRDMQYSWTSAKMSPNIARFPSQIDQLSRYSEIQLNRNLNISLCKSTKADEWNGDNRVQDWQASGYNCSALGINGLLVL